MKKGHGAALCLVLLFGLHMGLTRTYEDWWFEDDVYQRHFIESCPEPLVYFTDNNRSYSFNMGRTFTPLLAFTLYVDHLMSPKPLAAYLHTLAALALAVYLLYLLLLPHLKQGGAIYACGLWLFLPSTLVITEFIATRHYLEGLVFSLAALLLALRLPFQTRAGNWAGVLGSALLFYLAALCKEVYVTFTFYSLVGLFFYRKQWTGLAVTFGAGVAYAAHRLWFLQGVSRDSFPFHWGLLQDFQSLPYVLIGNNGGYALSVMLILFLVLAVVKRELLGFKLLWVLGGVGVLLVSILPVYLHLHVGHQDPSTWHRLVFLSNTFFLVLGVWLAQRVMPSKQLPLLGVLCAIAVLPSSWEAAAWWDETKDRYETEAQFYLDHPNRLLYTELPAAWFIGNVQDLYGGDTMPHYIDRDVLLDRGVIGRLLEDHQEIWRLTPKGYQSDPELHKQLKEMNRDMKRPFTPPKKPGSSDF